MLIIKCTCAVPTTLTDYDVTYTPTRLNCSQTIIIIRYTNNLIIWRRCVCFHFVNRLDFSTIRRYFNAFRLKCPRRSYWIFRLVTVLKFSHTSFHKTCGAADFSTDVVLYEPFFKILSKKNGYFKLLSIFVALRCGVGKTRLMKQLVGFLTFTLRCI